MSNIRDDVCGMTYRDVDKYADSQWWYGFFFGSIVTGPVVFGLMALYCHYLIGVAGGK